MFFIARHKFYLIGWLGILKAAEMQSTLYFWEILSFFFNCTANREYNEEYSEENLCFIRTV